MLSSIKLCVCVDQSASSEDSRLQGKTVIDGWFINHLPKVHALFLTVTMDDRWFCVMNHLVSQVSSIAVNGLAIKLSSGVITVCTKEIKYKTCLA